MRLLDMGVASTRFNRRDCLPFTIAPCLKAKWGGDYQGSIVA